MIKKTSLLLIVALFLLACENKNEMIQVKVDLPPTPTVEIVEEVKIGEVEEEIKPIEKKLVLPDGFIEQKVLKPIGINVPKTCKEWSDGCNTCSRATLGQSSCTTYTCDHQAPFSCLQWQ